MATARHIAADRLQRTDYLSERNSTASPHPVAGLLPRAETPDVLRSLTQSLTQLRSKHSPRSRHFLVPHSQRLFRSQPIPALRIAPKRSLPAATDTVNDPLHPRLQSAEPCASCGETFHHCVSRAARDDPHHSTTLFSGYSTMPCAFASFSRGITSQAAPSSITVFTASHSSSLR